MTAIDSDQGLPFLRLDLLRTFVAIVDTGSFTKAASGIGRSPSALSMQIKELESTLRHRLLLRERSRTIPSEAGWVLLEYARKMLAENRSIVSRLTSPSITGYVRLGVSEEHSAYVSILVRSCSQLHESIEIDVVATRSSLLRRLLDNNELDIALLNEASPSGANAAALFREPLVWASAKGVKVHLAATLPIAVNTPDCEWRQKALRALDSNNRDFRLAYEGGCTSCIRSVVQAGLAIAPLPLSLVTNDMIALGKESGLPDIGTCTFSLYVGIEPNPAAQVLAALVRTDFICGTPPSSSIV